MMKPTKDTSSSRQGEGWSKKNTPSSRQGEGWSKENTPSPRERGEGWGEGLPILLLAAALALPLPAAAHETESTTAQQLDPDFDAGKKAIEGRNWAGAIDAFTKVAVRDPGNADVQNYLGFASRSAGRTDAAFKHYRRALELNPRHRGAHEYIGELYLQTHNVAKAEEHLATLDRLCLLPCQEYTDLRTRISAYKATKR